MLQRTKKIDIMQQLHTVYEKEQKHEIPNKLQIKATL